jgi:PIN domain nuclease of toxin-antitoxin system
VIVLDTHALIWWVSEPTRVPARARRLLDAAVKAGERIAVSSISIWEVVMLVDRGRLMLTLAMDVWIEQVESLAFLEFQPVDNRIATRAVRLENFPHRDPADRMITATALELGATLITADAQLRAYAPVKTVWD